MSAAARSLRSRQGFYGGSRGAAGMMRLLIALLAMAAGIPAAAAQGDGGDAAAITDRLLGIDERLESINQSNAQVLWVSVAIAIVAAGAAIYYASQLKKQLKLAEDDVEHRLRPVLDWRMLEDGSPIRVSAAGERPSGLTIRVINTGQVSARNIVAYQDARIVGSGALPLPRMRRLGALGPGEFVDMHIPMSAENLGSAMGGGLAYVEARLSYSDGAGNELEYTVAGYMSSTVSTLFDEGDAAPQGGRKRGRPRPPAGEPAPAGGEEGAGPPARAGQSRTIQSFGLHARSFVGSMGSHEAMSGEAADRVIGECRAALKDDANDAAAHRNMAAALRSLGRHDDALDSITLATKADPKDAAALEEMARILVGLGRHDEAIGSLRLALEMGGSGLHAPMELARIHVTLGEYNEAQDALAGIVREGSSYEAHVGLASVCMVLRQYGPAALALGNAIKKRPGDALAHAQKGIAQLGYGSHEKAALTLKRAIALDGGLADAHVNLAHALHMLGRGEEAARELDIAVAADPRNQKAHVDRGIRMLETGRLREARESFAEAKRLDPSMLVPQAGAAHRGRDGRRGPTGFRGLRQGRHARAGPAR